MWIQEQTGVCEEPGPGPSEKTAALMSVSGRSWGGNSPASEVQESQAFALCKDQALTEDTGGRVAPGLAQEPRWEGRQKTQGPLLSLD